MKLKKITNRVKMLVMLMTAVILVGSCKKDLRSDMSVDGLTNQQKIAKAKTWYEAENKTTTSFIKSSKGDSVKLVFEPNWDKATVSTIDGVSVVSTYVNTTLRNFDKGQTRYHLVIKLDNDGYKAKTVTVKQNQANSLNVSTPEELYELAFTNREQSKDLNAHVKVFSSSFKQEKEERFDFTGKTTINFARNAAASSMQTNDITLCIDFWIHVRAYDSDGNLLFTITTFVFTDCQPRSSTEQEAIWWIDKGDGTYGGPPVYEEASIWPAATFVSDSPFTDDIVDGVYTRTWNVNWQFATATLSFNTLTGLSTEVCKTYLHPTLGWQWESVSNLNYSTSGTAPSGTSFMQSNYSTVLNTSYGSAEVTLTAHLLYQMGGLARSTPPVTTTMTFAKK